MMITVTMSDNDHNTTNDPALAKLQPFTSRKLRRLCGIWWPKTSEEQWRRTEELETAIKKTMEMHRTHTEKQESDPTRHALDWSKEPPETNF